MNKTVTFALSLRVKAALCCSAAILLTACGGAVDETGGQQSLAGVTAGDIMEESGAGTTGVAGANAATPNAVVQETAPEATAQVAADAAAQEAPAPAVLPADPGIANAVPADPTAAGPAPATNEFNLNGYQANSAAPSSDAAIQGTTAASSADGQQATQPPAA
ncbi:hypothetical protein [Telluria beijingensis]|uniref:hypothetical protein n=1 Tax=Telluria beijingensis TaxID=3068633 RepID=UPI002795D04F|nr:hypothetical protein [Massilia sp. REN29]